MTHPTSSLVSRRSRTHPQLAPQHPTPIVRVKRGARFRARPSSHLQQPYHHHQRHTSSWQQHCEAALHDATSPQSTAAAQQDYNNSYPPIPEEAEPEHDGADDTKQQPQYTDIFPFEETSPPPSQHEHSSLSVSTPSTQYGFRCTSEPALLVSYPAASGPESLHGDFKFNWDNSQTAELDQAQQCEDPQDMSTLGYMLPAHFSPLEPFPPVLDSPELLMDSHHSSHYLPSSSPQQVLPTPTSAPSSAYLPSFPSSPALLGNSPSGVERRLSGTRQEPPVMPPYPHRNSYHGGSQSSPYQPRISSPYEQSTLRTSPAPMSYSSADAPSILSAPPQQPSGYPAIPSNISSQGLGGLSYGSSYPPPQQYVSSAYDIPSYHSTPQSIYPQSSASSYPPAYLATALGPDGQPSHSSGANGSSATGPSSGGSNGGSGTTGSSTTTIDGRNVRVINQRPKPQCWEHGCNGRQFSTFSNLLRHQREKSGTAGKSYCPRCGAEFTRTTAMKGHMNNDKCKPRRTSAASETAP